MLRATKIRIYPTPEQAEFLNRQFGSVRFIYIKSLAIISHQYSKHGKSLSAKKDMKKLLPIAKKSRRYSWMKDFDSIALQQSCINLDVAFSKFFNKSLPNKYPKFKRKHGPQSSYHCTSIHVGGNWIKIPKIKSIKARVHREVEGKLKSISLSRTSSGKYFASLLFDNGTEQSQLVTINSNLVIGVDMGLTHIAITSAGQKTDNPRFTKRAALNLRRKQKSLSRKQKGSSNRAKARLLVAKCHEKVANTRNEFQHDLSNKLLNKNHGVAIETLKVKNMLKNRKLSKAICDASWSSLISKLEYKAKERGKCFVKIDQWFASSKTCHCCGHKVKKLDLKVRKWTCSSCNAFHDRDINAAINIKQQGLMKLKAEGLSVSANGGLRKTSEKLAAA